MNEFFKTWTDAWSANQQAMKSMFPMPATPAAGGEEAQAPLDAQFKELRETWQASMEKWTEFTKAGLRGGALTPEALSEFFGPATWSGAGTGAFDASLRQVLEGPKYATLWDQDRKLLELQRRAVERDKDVAAYQAVVQKAWNTAFQRFSTSFAGAKAEGPATWRGLTDRWLKVVNDTLIEVHRSEEFLDAQRKMLRSASEYRLQERKIAEAWCEASHIPTRTEMDEMQQMVAELKRELRVLQRRAKISAAAAEKPDQVVAKPARGSAAAEPAEGSAAPVPADVENAAAAKPAKGATEPAKAPAAGRKSKPAAPHRGPASGSKAPSTRRSTRTGE